MSTPRWELQREIPTDWPERMDRCGGGVFHSPVGLTVSDLPGDPWYATYRDGSRVLGVAAGLWRRCRLSTRPRHVYLPATPALSNAEDLGAALPQLVSLLAGRGAAEVIMDSFDQPAIPDAPPGAFLEPERREYLVRLDAPAEALVQRWSVHHRRRFTGIAAADWELRVPEGDAAQALLVDVLRHAATRAADRGTGFDLPHRRVQAGPFDPRHAWGAALFSAWRGEVPLAAALIGWAGRRSYYLHGGATPEGYACNASLWLHWRIMTTLAGAGVAVYSLGGVPASAVEPDAPGFGLHRFKIGFGSEVVPCRGLRWEVRSGHLRAHRAVSWGKLHLRRAGVTA